MNTKQNNINGKKITFKEYYNSLSDEHKKEIRNELLEVITESHFYACVRSNKFTKPLQRLITTITNTEFDWNHEDKN